MKLQQWAYQRVGIAANVSAGRNLHLGFGSRLWAPNRLVLGDDVYVGKWCSIEVDGRIGDATMIANNVGVVGKHDHDFSQVGVPVRGGRWVGDIGAGSISHADIGSDVWIGFGAVVLTGAAIGDSSIVGAGAVVVSDIPPNCVAVGSPARVVRNRFADDVFVEHWDRLQESGIRRSRDIALR